MSEMNTKICVETLKPLADKVLLRLEPRVKKVGAIIMPDSVEMSVWHSGIVVKTGPGKMDSKGKRTPSCLVAGQKAVFKAFPGSKEASWEQFEGDDGLKYIILPESSVEFCMPAEPEKEKDGKSA